MRVKLAVSAVVAVAALAAPAFADNGGRPLSTTLSGAEECNNLGVCGVGDPDGTGTADLRINPGQEEVCFTITVANIGAAGSSVRAHIHAAPAGSNGAIVVPLVEPAGPLPASGVLQGCQAATRERLLDILLNPEQYYVNVHTLDFPAGAIRGQLGD